MIIKSATDPTKTTTFLVPVLGFQMKELKDCGFINGYSFIKEERGLKDCIYMLFKPITQFKLGELIDKHKEKIISEIDYDKGYTVIVCPFPVKYINDKNLFWQGKYSYLSSGYKSNLNIIDNKLALSVIKRDKDLKMVVEERIGMTLPEDSEIASKPDILQETLNIEIFLKD